MTKHVTVGVKFDELAAELRRTPGAEKLSPAALRAVLVAGTISGSYMQAEKWGIVDPAFTFSVVQVNWLAERALADEGLHTEAARLRIFNAADAILARIVDRVVATVAKEQPPVDVKDLN